MLLLNLCHITPLLLFGKINTGCNNIYSYLLPVIKYITELQASLLSCKYSVFQNSQNDYVGGIDGRTKEFAHARMISGNIEITI